MTVTEGDDQPFTITPGDGAVISDVEVDGVSVTEDILTDDSAALSYTFPAVEDDHLLKVTFSTPNLHINTLASDGFCGSVSFQSGKVRHNYKDDNGSEDGTDSSAPHPSCKPSLVVNGRRRHIVTDVLGLIVGLPVHSAGASKTVTVRGCRSPPWSAARMGVILADGGCTGKIVERARRFFGRVVEACHISERHTLSRRFLKE